MTRVFLAYALSGLVSLGYQVVWFRTYVDAFGSTNVTFALVLCNFIGGLGLGAVASRRVTDGLCARLGIVDRLRAYGVVELGVTAAVLLTVLARSIPAETWGPFPYALSGGMYEPTWGYQLAKLAVATLCVFTPCFLMGVTFPLLCAVWREDGRFPSALYAWNTLGACSGVVLTQLVLLPRLGHHTALWALVGVNAAIGLLFLATGGAPAGARRTAADGRADGSLREVVTEPSDGDVATSTRPAEPSTLVFCAVLGGLLTGALEGDMFKRVGFVSIDSAAAMSFVSFWAIAAIFLASWIVRAWSGLRLFHVKVANVLVLVVYGAAWMGAYPLREWLTDRVYAPLLASLEPQSAWSEDLALAFPTSLGQGLVFVGAFVFPAFLLASLLLPWACNRMQAEGRHLGRLYGLNTLAFCLGTVAFTWVAPRVSVFYSLKLVFVVLAVGAGLLMLVSETRRVAGWKLGAAAAALAVGAALTPGGFDVDAVDPHGFAARYPVRALESNGAHTTYVVAHPEGDMLFFDNHPMSAGLYDARVYMRLMAHFPLLAQERPERALLICYGVGNTAAAIAAHGTIESLDVVELNDKVVKTAPEFGATTNEVWKDPRLRFIHDDGRNFLGLTDRVYDLVTSEPPPPMQAGVYRLYAKEYYEQVLAHLSDDGLMTQWLPAYQMPLPAVDLALRTFVQVFPHVLLITGYDREFVMVGGRRPIDLARIERRFGEDEDVVRDLASLGIGGPVGLLSRIVRTESELKRDYGAGRVISDARNDLVYLFHTPLRRAVLDYDPEAVLSDPAVRALSSYDELRAVIEHLGRLRHVADFPFKSLASVPATAAPGVALAGADWRGIDWLLARAIDARVAGRLDEAIDLVRQALGLAREQPELLLELAQLLLEAGRPAEVLDPLMGFARLEPADPSGDLLRGQALAALERHDEAASSFRAALGKGAQGAPVHAALGRALRGAGRVGDAIPQLREAVRLAPEVVDHRFQLGHALFVFGEIEEAIREYRTVLREAPDFAEAHNNLGVALARRGRLTEAVAAFARAVELDPDYASARDNLATARAQVGGPRD